MASSLSYLPAEMALCRSQRTVLHSMSVGPSAIAGTRDGLLHRVVDQSRIVAVDRHAGQAETFGTLRDIFDRDRHFGRHRDGKAIVLANHDERHFPQRRHVKRFEERAFAGSAVAEEGDHDAAVLAELVAQCEAGGDRDMGRNNRVVAPKLLAHVAEVHRSAAPAATASFLAQQFRHEGFDIQPLRDRVPMAAIRREDLVGGFHGRCGAHANGFLADARMRAAAEQSLAKTADGIFFEIADRPHLLVPVEQRIVR